MGTMSDSLLEVTKLIFFIFFISSLGFTKYAEMTE